eukprot:PhM_4_TR11344/c0_g1_i1/m.55677
MSSIVAAEGVSFPFTIKQYAFQEVRGPLAPVSTVVNTLADDEVLVKVTHCSVCRSDIHVWHGDWGPVFTKPPQVVGHEITGVVAAIGSAKCKHNVGDRVAVGWTCGSCSTCEQCVAGNQIGCSDIKRTVGGMRGGLASHVVSDTRWLVSLPSNMKSLTAAPLLCAGITVFRPMDRWVKPGMTVGVIGIGGLGHLALKFARAMGCKAVAFTSSPSKIESCKEFGATDVVVTSDEASWAKAEGKIDVIIDTIDAPHQIATYLPTMRRGGVFVMVGMVPDQTFSGADIMRHFISQGKILTGSVTGTPTDLRRMFEVASMGNVEATVEEYSEEQVAEAMERTAEGKARFRAVVKFSD